MTSSTNHLWNAWLAFGATVLKTAHEFLPSDVSACLQEQFSSTASEAGAADENAIRSFFTDVPAHVMAIRNLDHSCFVNSLVLQSGRISLLSIMEMFAHNGRVPYGRVWLALLDVAHAANPSGIDPEPGRKYIVDLMRSGDSNANACVPHSNPNNNNNTNNNVFGDLLVAFPGLQDCITKLMGTGSMDATGCRLGVAKRTTDSAIRDEWNHRSGPERAVETHHGGNGSRGAAIATRHHPDPGWVPRIEFCYVRAHRAHGREHVMVSFISPQLA